MGTNQTLDQSRLKWMFPYEFLPPASPRQSSFIHLLSFPSKILPFSKLPQQLSQHTLLAHTPGFCTYCSSVQNVFLPVSAWRNKPALPNSAKIFSFLYISQTKVNVHAEVCITLLRHLSTQHCAMFVSLILDQEYHRGQNTFFFIFASSVPNGALDTGKVLNKCLGKKRGRKKRRKGGGEGRTWQRFSLTKLWSTPLSSLLN